MDKKQELLLFEKDNSYEINNFDITTDQLKKVGVPLSVLSTETYLRKYYGDVIYTSSSVDGVEEKTDKKIQKLGEDDMSIDKNYKQVCADIEESEFDKALDEITIS